MPQGIALGVDEKIVKQYHIGRYTFRQGSIDVIVTNKRVIRYEESSWLGMQNNQIDEINIDAVHGTSTSMVRSISILGIISSVVLFLVGLYGLFGRPIWGSYEYLVGAIALFLAIMIISKSFKPSLSFGLHGAIGGRTLETEVNLRGRLFRHDEGSIVFQFKPTSETTVMLKEIGALIYDLKT